MTAFLDHNLTFWISLNDVIKFMGAVALIAFMLGILFGVSASELWEWRKRRQESKPT